jgi:hypothetical protein
MWDIEGNELEQWAGARINDLAISSDGSQMVRTPDRCFFVIVRLILSRKEKTGVAGGPHGHELEREPRLREFVVREADNVSDHTFCLAFLYFFAFEYTLGVCFWYSMAKNTGTIGPFLQACCTQRSEPSPATSDPLC